MALDFMLLLLILLAVSTSSLKYVYVQTSVYWAGAQSHCQTHYTDLAPVSSEYDMTLLQQAADNTQTMTWIGLVRSGFLGNWMWSGGGQLTSTFWSSQEPGLYDSFGYLYNSKWYGTYSQVSAYFLCYSVHVERERMTWEDALHFCRKKHQDLASVASETEMMLMTKELLKYNHTTEHVWIGLRFLPDEWLWVDQQPLVYEAWGPNEQAVCPAMRCGALKVTGTVVESLGVKTVHVENVKEWNSRDCNEKLHFLCY